MNRKAEKLIEKYIKERYVTVLDSQGIVGPLKKIDDENMEIIGYKLLEGMSYKQNATISVYFNSFEQHELFFVDNFLVFGYFFINVPFIIGMSKPERHIALASVLLYENEAIQFSKKYLSDETLDFEEDVMKVINGLDEFFEDFESDDDFRHCITTYNKVFVDNVLAEWKNDEKSIKRTR